MKRAIYLIPAFLFITISCTSVKDLIDKGDYDGAILLAAKKLKGEEKPKTKYVKGLETAFHKVMAKDMEMYHFLDSKADGQSADKAYDIIRAIHHRQELIRPFLPLVSKDGYVAHFKFIKTLPILDKLAHKATEFHYEYAKSLLEESGNDKMKSRDAYYTLRRIERYFNTYKNSELLLNRAHELGKDRFWITSRVLTDAFLPAGLEEMILSINIRDMNSHWEEYFTDPKDPGEMDYKAILELVDLDVSPEREKERVYIDKKEIRDGFRYVLDKNGNVAKDSLGNDIKEDNFVEVRAEIFELFREKAAYIRANLKLIDLQREEIILTKPIDTEAVFSSYASRYNGDKRALCDLTRNRLRNRPEPFPSDFNLFYQAAEDMKYLLEKALRNYVI